MTDINVKTGDVLLVDLSNAIGHQQGGTRYAVVVSNNLGNRVSPTVEILPVITALCRPTHILKQGRYKDFQKERPLKQSLNGQSTSFR